MQAPMDVFFSDFITVGGGGMEKEPGAVRAFFRNGKFTNIVEQGKFDFPIVRRTMIGHIQAMNISTASHEVTVQIRDVVTKEGFVHPMVTVAMLLSLNRDNGYKAVAKMLTEQGRQAGTYLSAGMSSLVEAQVRTGFLAHMSDDLLGQPLLHRIQISLDTLANGAIRVEGIGGIDWDYAQVFKDLLATRAKKATLETTHEVEVIEQNHQLEMDQTATRQVISLDRERRDSEAIDEERDRQHELELARMAGLTEIAGKFFQSGRGTTKDFSGLLDTFAPPTLADRIAPAAPIGGGSAGHLHALEAHARTAESERIDRALPTLNIDARLKRIWLSLDLPDALAGCAFAAYEGSLGVVYVVSDAPMLSVDQLRPLESKLGEAFKADSVRIIQLPLVGSRQNLVENYLAQASSHVALMVGEAVNGSFHLDVQITDEAAVVRISGEKGSAVRRVLTDPKTCLINPLVTLLALDYADVELAE